MFRFLVRCPFFVTPPFTILSRKRCGLAIYCARSRRDGPHKKEKTKQNKIDKPFVVLRARSSRCGHLAGDPPSLFLIAERAPTVAVAQTHTKYGTEPTNHLLALQSRSGPYCPLSRWSCTGVDRRGRTPPPSPLLGSFGCCFFFRSRLLTPLPDSTKKQNKMKYKPQNAKRGHTGPLPLLTTTYNRRTRSHLVTRPYRRKQHALAVATIPSSSFKNHKRHTWQALIARSCHHILRAHRRDITSHTIFFHYPQSYMASY
jgi:hypothetical protein